MAIGRWNPSTTSTLTPHAQPPQSFAQVLAPTSAADSVTLTIYPALQRVAQRALAGRDGAAVVLDPQNGDILAMYSNPTYDPAPLTSSDYHVALAAWTKDNKRNVHGFTPLGELAIQQTFPPGSTFKIVTTSAVVVSNPGLLTKVYPNLTQTPLPNTKLKLHNYHFESCGGTIAEMLPPSCDTGFALVGLDVGATALSNAADSYGYDEIPPIDLPIDLGGAVPSNFPPASAFTYNLPQLAYSAIGQENVRTTALQNALVAAAVADDGKMMTPPLHELCERPRRHHRQALQSQGVEDAPDARRGLADCSPHAQCGHVKSRYRVRRFPSRRRRVGENWYPPRSVRRPTTPTTG